MRPFELKLAGGKVVVWEGESGEDAARSYVMSHDATVIAWRHPKQYITGGYLRLERVPFLEPGDKGWGR